MLKEWGTHPSWTRAVASPAPYANSNARLAELVGAPDMVVFPTITLLHSACCRCSPGEARSSSTRDRTLDPRSGRAARRLRARTIVHVRRSDSTDLDGKIADADPLAAPRDHGQRRLLDVGHTALLAGLRQTRPPLRRDALHRRRARHRHLGRNPDRRRPTARRWRRRAPLRPSLRQHRLRRRPLEGVLFDGCVRHVPFTDERTRSSTASTMVFSGPIPVASLATSLAGLRINADEGDALRRHVQRLTMRIIEGARHAGWSSRTTSTFPRSPW